MQAYVTFFNVGRDSETLIIDCFEFVTKEVVVWDSKEQYFAERAADPEIIDGGVYAYYLAAGTAALPDDLLTNQIVSYRAPSELLSMLRTLHKVVHTLRQGQWPTWPGENDDEAGEET